ncbi:MAG: IclR family transcriptional regulator [Spirochaetaceae bacterium]|nr:IclR family transcriptional regulator [Spirochaetaceae bacterium]MDT8298925.1 IclR family transcriptional regulator [Spirochaetaceae bacterium]
MVNTVSRAVLILEHLADHDDQGVSDIAKILEMPKSSTHSILSTLEHYSLVEKDERSGRYHLGLKLVELGYRAQGELGLVRVGRPFIQGLNRDTDETVHLTVLDHREVLYVDCVESRLRLRTYSVIGVRAPLYCTSVGKALLAWQDDTYIAAYLAETDFKPETSRTITDTAALRIEIEKIRSQGYAIDDREHEDHLRCIGAPIRNSRGEVFASVSVSGPEVRMTPERVKELSARVIGVAADISRKLGFRD